MENTVLLRLRFKLGMWTGIPCDEIDIDKALSMINFTSKFIIDNLDKIARTYGKTRFDRYGNEIIDAEYGYREAADVLYGRIVIESIAQNRHMKTFISTKKRSSFFSFRWK